MWTDTTRAHRARAELALPGDLTDAEWALLEPFFPPASHVGRPRKWPLRRIVEAILYLLRGGLPWRMLPPVSTVRRWFYLWRDNRLWLSLNHSLLLIGREAAGREVSPSAGVIDSQDRDGALLVLAGIIKRFPRLHNDFADGGYAGGKLREALRRIVNWTVEIVKRSDTAMGFVVLPCRWVVERTLAWLNRNRRLAKDFEQTIASATAWLFIAPSQLFARRIIRP